MARRLPDEPVSRFAIWARRLALFSLAVVLLAIVIARSGLLDIIPVLVTFTAGLALAVASILLAFAAFVVIWHLGLRGFGHAVSAVLIGLVMLAYPIYLGVKIYQLPKISDVSSDPGDPPAFEVIARLRNRQANPVAYRGLSAAELGSSVYSDIEPLELTVPPQIAYAAVQAALARRKDNPVAPLWRVIDERPPTPGREGHIEAIAYTSIMGFRDDVAIRIRPIRGGSRVDARSASRYGRWDFGVNAARVRRLLEDIDTAADSIKQEAPPPPKEPERRNQRRRRR